MSDKIVTRDDYLTLLELKVSSNLMPGEAADQLLDRLLAAAQADAPPLPLRPTVTPADVEKAVRAVEALEAKAVVDNKAYVRAAFEAAGIEVAR